MAWARRTTRLAERLTTVGLALGGAAGARLSRALGTVVSRNTLLRLVRRAPQPDRVTPCVLGVDDWALCKRDTYGTGRWHFCPIARRAPWPLGCANTPAWP